MTEAVSEVAAQHAKRCSEIIAEVGKVLVGQEAMVSRLLMGLLTNVVSNNAAAVIGTPIAIGIAQRLGLPAEPFILAVLFGANLSFATPMAYQTNILVMNAGGYKFIDFVRVGVPLVVIVWLILTWVLALAYGL